MAAKRRTKIRNQCYRGHEYTPENTVWRKGQHGNAPGRQCRICKNAARREWNLDRKVERILNVSA